MTKRKTKRKTNRKPVKMKHKSIKQKSHFLWEGNVIYKGKTYAITSAEEITEGETFTEYDGSKYYLPTFKKIFIKAVRKMDKGEIQ